MTAQSIGPWVDVGVLLLIFFVGVPTIAAVIVHAAWNGEPKNSSRETYFAKFLIAIIASGFLMTHATQMNAPDRSWQYAVQILCFLLGAFLFGVAGGCTIAMFVYGRGVPPQSPTDAEPPDQGV
jgi:hypothetical protein